MSLSDTTARVTAAPRAVSAPQPTAAGRTLDGLGLVNDWRWAWDNYRPAVLALARELGLTRLCEIGGGRNPLFTPAEAAHLGLRITVNDISAAELALAPAEFGKACFDISADLTPAQLDADGYDLMFSRMVFEHVRDVGKAWENVHRLLNDGGVALAFFPTLYALPYVANRLIPEFASRAIVNLLYPHRSDDGASPKFPAYYDHCYAIDGRVRPMLERAGFREIDIVPFWGHDYFDRLPVLREVDAALSRFARARDIRALTAYAYVVVRK